MARRVTTGIVWFRNDLRLDDNPAWAAATRSCERVVPLFVIEDRLMRAAGPFRLEALGSSLRSLDRDLAAVGGRLLIVGGPAGVTVPAVARRYGAGRVWWNADVTPFSISRDRAVARRVPHEIHHGRYVHPAGSILTQAGGPYRVFGPFYRRWSSLGVTPWPKPGSARVVGDVGDGLGALGSWGAEAGGAWGASAALRRLDAFVDRCRAYGDERDRPDLEATSRLSADLRFGTISPRRVLESVSRCGGEAADFIRQLAWREFAAQLMLAHPDLARSPLRPEFDEVRWNQDPAGLAAWTNGETGYPIVDAAMRQLRAEGWINNRMRMVAASFLIKDLLVDWRLGERHFRRLLVDGDPAQNAVNWQWVAGTGVDTAPYFRVLNPVTQAIRFDPRGDYVRRWIPELEGISGKAVHAPWLLGTAELASAGVSLGSTYPPPIVDHAVARRAALAAYAKAVVRTR